MTEIQVLKIRQEKDDIKCTYVVIMNVQPVIYSVQDVKHDRNEYTGITWEVLFLKTPSRRPMRYIVQTILHVLISGYESIESDQNNLPAYSVRERC